ncbi:unnamed protein product [Prunus armeniaca]
MGEQFGTPSGTSQYTYSHRIPLKFMNIRSSSQNPHHAMEINQVAFREGLESEESDVRHSAHDSTGSRRSRTSSRRMNLIQESVLRQEVTTQRSQDTLSNITAMMQWQVNMQFRKDREAAIARIPNPDVVVQQLDLPYGPPPGLAWPYQENPLIAQIAGMPERGEIQAGQRGGALPAQELEAPARPDGPAPVQIQQNQPEPHLIPQDQPLALLPEPPAVLPYRPRRMDPNPFPSPAKGRRGGRGNNFFANNDRNRLGANWRNNPDLKEQEEHREEVLPRPYRAEPRIDHAQLEQGRNHHPVNALNDVGALQRMIREMMEPEARRGERPTYRKPYPAYIDQIPLSPGFKVPNFTLFNGEDPHASSVEHIGRFSVQCIAIENNTLLKLRLFGNSLFGQAFTWYTNLPANSVQTWEQMESVFHDYYYRISQKSPSVTLLPSNRVKMNLLKTS